jgi:aryl-alcohol dehydrogenase-like predicted oxidoreductase
LGYGLAEFALAWCLRQKQVSSVIIGATAPDQVQANVKASGIKLDETIWDQAERLLAGQ